MHAFSHLCSGACLGVCIMVCSNMLAEERQTMRPPRVTTRSPVSGSRVAMYDPWVVGAEAWFGITRKSYILPTVKLV